MSAFNDAATIAPTRADTLYRLHSMTKPLFAVATLTLVEEGRLSLVEPISKYIPEFADVKVLAGGTADAPELEDPKSAPTVECQRETGRPKG